MLHIKQHQFYYWKTSQIIFSNASALNRIFTNHQIKNVNGHTEMRPYSQALHAINPLPNLETENIETILLILIWRKKSFIIVPYLLSGSSSANILVSRKLVAVVTNVKEHDIEIEYAIAVWKELNLLELTRASLQRFNFSYLNSTKL